MNGIGQYIKENRKRLKLSRKHLAEKLWLSEASIIKYERGERFPGNANILKKMSEVFGIPYHLLTEDSKGNPPDSNPFLFYLSSNDTIVKYHADLKAYTIIFNNTKIDYNSNSPNMFFIKEDDLNRANTEFFRLAHSLVSLLGREYGALSKDYEDTICQKL